MLVVIFMTTTFSIAQFCQYFPAIQEKTIFLDSTAIALKPNNKIAATIDYYQHTNTAIHSGKYPTVQITTHIYEQTRN